MDVFYGSKGNMMYPSQGQPGATFVLDRAEKKLLAKYELAGENITIRVINTAYILSPSDYDKIPELVTSGTFKEISPGTVSGVKNADIVEFGTVKITGDHMVFQETKRLLKGIEDARVAQTPTQQICTRMNL